MAGAYKATPIPVLEAETIIAPTDVHLDQLQAKARYRLRAGGQARVITTPCKATANKLQGKVGRKRLGQKMLPQPHIAPFLDSYPPWSDETPADHREEARAAKAAQHSHLREMTKHHMNAWTESWRAYQDRTLTPSRAQAAPLGKKALKDTHSPEKGR